MSIKCYARILEGKKVHSVAAAEVHVCLKLFMANAKKIVWFLPHSDDRRILP